jgi:uncharacterized protein (DUF2164 family)
MSELYHDFHAETEIKINEIDSPPKLMVHIQHLDALVTLIRMYFSREYENLVIVCDSITEMEFLKARLDQNVQYQLISEYKNAQKQLLEKRAQFICDPHPFFKTLKDKISCLVLDFMTQFMYHEQYATIFVNCQPDMETELNDSHFVYYCRERK